MRRTKHIYSQAIFFSGLLLFLLGMSYTAFTQINQAFVIIQFAQTPTTDTAYVAALKYNKQFALSMQIDDGTDDIYTHAFPVFMGGTVDGVTYPGLTYTDGCGNEIHFKMSSSVYSFNGTGENGPDIHLPGNGYGKISWPQMDTLYKNNWGIFNHGVNGNSAINPLFIDYSIKRNQSYIRRKLYKTTAGGVITRLFVNPDGHYEWTQPAFDLGYRGALNQNIPSPLSMHGGNVNNPSVDWTQPQNLYRVIAEDINVLDFAAALADSSTNGANFWGSMFTHSVVTQYSFPNFVSDFTTIASLYGTNGQDNIFMATDEEIIDYLIVRSLIVAHPVLNGSTMVISFTGEVPHNLRFYDLSLVVESNATISSILVSGIDSVTYSGIGTNNALINLNWDDYIVTPPQVLADSFTSIATNTNAQYDCWVAEDYVITLENGFHKDSLRQALCAVPNTVYDSGFCSCSITLNQDTTLMAGQCDTLYGPTGDYTYEWYVADTLYDTTQNIYICPDSTSLYRLIATNSLGCPAEDSILVSINFLSVDLGPDTTICANQCVNLSGPPGMANYQWIVADTVFDTVQTILVCPIDTTQYILNVTDTIGNQASDSIVINVLPSPNVNIGNDTALCLGDSLVLSAPVAPSGASYSYLWNTGDTSQTIIAQPNIADSIFIYYVDVTGDNGCASSDTINITVDSLPQCKLQADTLKLCKGISADFFAIPGNCIKYVWHYGNVIDTSSFSHLHINQVDSSYMVYLESYNESGCHVSDSTYLLVYPLPGLKVSNDTSACYGDSLTVTATGAETYLWTLNGEMVSNQSAIKVAPQVGDNKYFVEGTNQYNCITRDSIVVTVFQMPSTRINYDTNEVCLQSEITLTATGALHYLWAPGGDTNSVVTFLVEDTTTYYLTGFTNDGCTVSDSLTIKTLPIPQVSLTGLLPAYCQNDEDVTLYGTPLGGTFSGTGITGNIFSPAMAGTGNHLISYTFINGVGCAGIDSATTIVYGGGNEILLIPSDTVLISGDSVVFDAGAGFDHYYWSTGDTSRIITVHYSDFPKGTYTFIVIGVINNCTSRGTSIITFSKPNGIIENTNPAMVVYPNPNNGSFTISYVGIDSRFKLVIRNGFGQTVYLLNNIGCTDNCKKEITLHSLEKGIYFLQLSSQSGTLSTKIIVK